MPDINNVVVHVLIVRGAGEEFDEANIRAKARLVGAARKIELGEIPDDPGVQYLTEDPGGGGGPCEPNKKVLEYTTNAGGLPEAVGDDD